MGFTFSDHDGALYWDQGHDEGRELSLQEAAVIAATQQVSALRAIAQGLSEVAEAITDAARRLEPKDD